MLPNLAWAGFTLSPAVGAALMSLSTIVIALIAQLLRHVSRIHLPRTPLVGTQRHPELSTDAIQALAWNFSYQSK